MNFAKVAAVLCCSCVLLFSCSKKRSQKLILNFAGGSEMQSKFDDPASAEWKLIPATNQALSEDSLKEYSCLILPFSSLNKFDFRALNNLQRYLEGGGGVVAIKDTLLSQSGWNRLQEWNNLKIGEKHKQDKGRIWILTADYGKSELTDGIAYAMGNNSYPDYDNVQTVAVPDSSRYTKIVLAEGLDEPLEMEVLPNNNVLFVERKGGVKIYDAESKKVKTIANLNVYSGIEDGLLGVALDPDFANNHWAYFYYAPAGLDSVDRLSRFELRDDSLLLASEKILLEVPTQRIYCCHSAGSVEFGPDGLLYVSVGDNTNAEETEGYTPVDQRLGHELADDQATAANTNDLRGKILRIRPEPDGTYSIPKGNLFPEGTPKTRPEIYAMGLRNPFRISIDRKTNALYWGDVGPDTKVKGRDGSFMSYDEINVARTPGFYGWPYFLGDNDAFPMYDFATKKEGPRKDKAKPINDSRNNTGLRELPVARPAMIWYGKSYSPQYPLVGAGGASAMAGPVYYADAFKGKPYKLSEYYNGKLLIYEWIRHWIMAVTLDENGNYVRMEPFLDHLKFAAPIDMKFGPDGALYVLEYGTNWFSKNSDARLVRVEYQEGNRNPVAVAKVDKQFGAAPLTVKLSGQETKDHDKGDKLKYAWEVNGETLNGETGVYTFKKPGTYQIKLTVQDDKGGQGESITTVSVGNSPPTVKINSLSNRSFYWEGSSFDYRISVADKEDKTPDPEKVKVSFGFLSHMKEVALVLSEGRSINSVQYFKGQQIMASLDCNSCHSPDKASVGPSYRAVATRYAGKPGVTDMLVKKVIDGGSGNWGNRPMSPHPHLSPDNAREIVNYILSLSQNESALPQSGNLALDRHAGKEAGAYVVSASYTDKGANGIKPLKGTDNVVLRHPRIQAEDYEGGKVNMVFLATQGFGFIYNLFPGTFIKFNKLDLTRVKQVKYRVQPAGAGGNIELRLGSPTGRVVSSINVPAGSVPDFVSGWKEIAAPVEEVKGEHDLYFVFANGTAAGQNLLHLDWIHFLNK